MRRALLQAAWAATRVKDGYLAAQFRRLAKRRGEKRAAVAVAHSILRLVYRVLTTGSPYQELGAAYSDQQEAGQRLALLQPDLPEIFLHVVGERQWLVQTQRAFQALAFVRARHIKGDLIPDFSRISRQQQFMRALITKVLSAGSLLHITDFIKAIQDNLRMDANLNLYALQDLTRKLGELGQGGVVFRIVTHQNTILADL